MDRISISDSFAISADFPGGNVIVDRIEGREVFLRQDLRDTEGFWFYWCFRVAGAQGQTLSFNFTDGGVVGVRGPSYSVDGGKSWTWLGSTDDAHFDFAFSDHQEDVVFAFAPLYLESHLKQFLSGYPVSQNFRVDTLCTTEGGRDVEVVGISPNSQTPNYCVLVTARHHACESMASFVLQGMIEELLTQVGEQDDLSEAVEYLFIPFVDKDGVERGDQGKNRRPRDHNRDYEGHSIYNSVRAIREFVPQWVGDRRLIALDLHCPYISGERNEELYMVMPNHTEAAAHIEVFAHTLEDNNQRPLPYRASRSLQFGVDWNQPTPEGKNFSQWANEQTGTQFAVTLEIPYANSDGVEVTPHRATLLGKAISKSVSRYISADLQTGERSDLG